MRSRNSRLGFWSSAEQRAMTRMKTTSFAAMRGTCENESMSSSQRKAKTSLYDSRFLAEDMLLPFLHELRRRRPPAWFLQKIRAHLRTTKQVTLQGLRGPRHPTQAAYCC